VKDVKNRGTAYWKLQMLWILALISTACIGGCNETATDLQPGSDEVSDRPNIIYILADDLGYGDLPSYREESPIRTPNLDRMASEGVRFTQHYAGSTVCAPSRSVLMTGLHVGRTPIRGNREIMPIGQYPLQYHTVTIASILQKAGYATGAFGKWGLGYPGSEGMPTLQGFDEFFGFLDQRRSHFFYPEFLFHDVRGEELLRVPLEGNVVRDVSRENFQRPGSGPAIEKAYYSQDVITERALAFIEAHQSEPFFLYVPSQIPHASLEVPDETLGLYLDGDGNSLFDEEPFPGAPMGYSAQEMPAAAYAAMVTRLDHYIGQIIAKLEELGIAGNTLVMFSSDNGSYSEGGYHYSMLGSNDPLRGGKRDLYEGGIRVPFIAWWPGVIEAGRVSDHISGFQDMMPTFSELAGVAPSPLTTGISLIPSLLGPGGPLRSGQGIEGRDRGERTGGDQIEDDQGLIELGEDQEVETVYGSLNRQQQQHEYLYWEFHAQGGKQAVRTGDWKGVRLNILESSDAPIELYNLTEDIGEEINVADQHPDIVERMNQIMHEAHVPSEIFPLFENSRGR